MCRVKSCTARRGKRTPPRVSASAAQHEGGWRACTLTSMHTCVMTTQAHVHSQRKTHHNPKGMHAHLTARV